MHKRVLVLLLSFWLVSCNLAQGSTPLPTPLPATAIPPSVSAPTLTSSPTIPLTDTFTATPASTASATFTPLPSETLTSTVISTQTGSPTPLHPTVVSKANTNCRYGPDSAYLYLYGLNPGGTAEVFGRNYAGNWLWVQPTGTPLLCWVATSSVNLPVDIHSIPIEYPPLPTNSSVVPPTGVHAMRSGNSVTVSWNAAAPAVQLGYLIEASICSKGYLIDVVATTTGLSYTLTDDKTCSQASSGQVRVQNKLGYSSAVKIPWP